MKRKLGAAFVVCLGVALATPAHARSPQAQPALKIDLVRMLYFPPDNVSIDVYVSADVVSAPSNSSVTVTFLPSDKAVPSSAVVKVGIQAGSSSSATQGGGRILQIELKDLPAAAPQPGDTEVRVEFATLNVASNQTINNISGTGKVYNKANKDELVQDLQKGLKQTAANEKTSDEKNIFLGLNISVPSGGGDRKGDGDLAFNRTVYASQIGSSLNLSRSQLPIPGTLCG